MKIKQLFYSCFFILFTLNSCSSVKIVDKWNSSKKNNLSQGKTLVINLSERMNYRVSFENQIVNQLEKKNITAVQSYLEFSNKNLFKNENKKSLERWKNRIEKRGFKNVIITRLVDRSKIKQHYPDLYKSNYFPFYEKFDNYWQAHNFTTHQLGYIVNMRKYTLETVVYNLSLPKKNQLVSAIISQIYNPTQIVDLPDNFAKKIVRNLISK